MFFQRFNILVLVCFFIHVFSITLVEPKMRKLAQPRILKNRSKFNLIKRRKRESKLQNIKSNFYLYPSSEFVPKSVLKIQPFTPENNEMKNKEIHFNEMKTSTLISDSLTIPIKNLTSSKLKRKNLTDFEKSTIEENLTDFTDHENSSHVRVKRDISDKNNNRHRFQSNYLEDLAASFPKSEHELEEEKIASIDTDKVEDDRVFKRSSDSDNNEERLYQSCHLKVNRNPQNSRYKEYSRMQRINSGLDDVELQKRRYNKEKQYLQMYAIEDGSDDYLNDNRKEKYLQNSNRNHFGNADQRIVKNVARRNEKICNKLHSANLKQPEHKRELILKINEIRSDEKNNIKNEAIEEASMRFPGKAVRQSALLRDKRRMKKSEDKTLKKKKKNTKKHNKNQKVKGSKNKKDLKHSRKTKKSD